MFLQQQNMFKHKSVLITGSNKGLGKELAFIFASNDYNVILHGRNEEDLKSVEKKILAKNKNVCYVVGDLRDNETLDRLYESAQEKEISVLVNNAGVLVFPLQLETMTDENIDELLNVNLSAPIKLTKRIYNLFLENGTYGTIININSILGMNVKELKSVYCASKWGLRGFSEAFKIEAKKNNIRVIDVYPTRIRTREEYSEGIGSSEAANQILDFYENTSLDELVLGKKSSEL